MQRTAMLLVGISGSGKSHLTAQLVEALPQGATSAMCSADKWMVNRQGIYVHDMNRLGYCHRRSEGEFYDALQSHTDLVISDNTNIVGRCRAPYIKMGWRAGYRVVMNLLEVDPEVAFVRHTHDCTPEVHAEQARRMAILLQTWGPGAHELTPSNYPLPSYTAPVE